MDVREETSAALGALAALADRADGQGWSKLALALRTAVDSVEARLRSPDVTIVVAGGRSKRALLDLLAGDTLFALDAKEAASAFVEMRRGERPSYVARFRDGRAEDFAQKTPDRAAWYRREIAKAEKELDETTLRITTLDVELTAREETLSERRLRTAEKSAAPKGFFAVVLAWILSLLRIERRPQLAPADGRVVSAMIARRDIERSMESAEHELAKRRAAIDALRAEAALHDEERRVVFVKNVAALTDGAARGADVTELAITVAGGMLPEGIVVIDAPAAVTPEHDSVDQELRRAHLREVRDRAAACILVAAPGSVAVGDLEDALRPVVPHVVDADDLEAALPSLFERAKEEAPWSTVALAVADMPSRVLALARAVATGESEQKTRIDALERDRLPEPKTFREEQLSRMAGSIDDAAHRVLDRARERVHARAGELEQEWLGAIDACADRASLDECAARIDGCAGERATRLLDGVGDDIASEMQAATEVLQISVIEEVRRRYKTRSVHADKTAPVVAELPSDEIATLGTPPLSRALRSFERKRVGVALGSIATATAMGGAIHALAGAAIGAVAGIIAGIAAIFVQRTQAARNECRAAIRARVADLTRIVVVWLDESRETFARDIRAAVDDTLQAALKRRDRSIIMLIDREGQNLEREQHKLRELTELGRALEEEAARLARLAETSASALREHVARTRKASTVSSP